jgi:hypothetical protein
VGDIGAQIAGLEQRAAEARRRAASAQAAAARFGEQAVLAPASFSRACMRAVALQQRVEACHLGSARLQEQYADRLRGRLEWSGALRPAFLDAVTAAIGMPSAAIVLLAAEQWEAVVAASDSTARAAHDLEFVLGEGPAHLAVARGQTVQVAGTALCDCWPQYGPAVTRLGVRAVIAVPLLPPAGLGAVCAYASQPAISKNAAMAAIRIADALPLTLAQAAGGSWSADDVAELPLFGEGGFPAMVHRAAGMLSQQCGCEITDALALLRARAFSTGRPAEEIAARVLRGELRLS